MYNEGSMKKWTILNDFSILHNSASQGFVIFNGLYVL